MNKRKILIDNKDAFIKRALHLNGYTKWGSKKPDMPARVLDEYGMFPSIYSLLRRQKPDNEIGVIYDWEGIGYLFPKAAVNPDGDIAVTNAAQRNKELSESIMTFDTAAIIADLLKLKAPQVWIGRPVKGALNKE